MSSVLRSLFLLYLLEGSNERSNRMIRYEAGWKCLITKGQSRPTFPLLSGHVLSCRAPMYPRFSNNRYFYQSAVVYEHARSCPIPSLLPNNLGFFLFNYCILFVSTVLNIFTSLICPFHPAPRSSLPVSRDTEVKRADFWLTRIPFR